MELKIYSSDGRLKLTVEPRDNSTQAEEIQAGNVLNVSFILPERVSLGVNDYADFMWRRYWLTEKYRTEIHSRVGVLVVALRAGEPDLPVPCPQHHRRGQ